VPGSEALLASPSEIKNSCGGANKPAIHFSVKRSSMEEENKPAQPVMSEYQGKPVLRVPTVDAPNPDISWHWVSFGKNKAKAIVKHFEAIKKFAEE
jgi:hypothetical protein